jgi:integrase
MFTDKGIKGLKHSTAGQRDVWEGGKIKCFGIRVGKKTKTFFVGIRVKGKYQRISLGQYDETGESGLTLKEARDRAYQIVADAQAGIGPELRKKREQRGTFGAVAHAFMQDYANSHRTRKEYQRKIDVDLREWHDVPMASITRSMIKEILRVKARTAPIAANRLLALISTIFSWALKEELIESSPAMKIDRPGKEMERERSLSAEEIAIAWSAFNKLGYPYGHLFKMLLVTGQRRGEVAGMKWIEITPEGWRLPAERAKNGKGHLVPLSSLAREVLTDVPELGSLVLDHVVTLRHGIGSKRQGDFKSSAAKWSPGTCMTYEGPWPPRCGRLGSTG